MEIFHGLGCVPRVSVLVPNLNNANYISERLDSILCQTFLDFEVIVCDSYSSDGAWEIINDYASRDARISAYQVPRAGIYAGWNECLLRARGEYVYFATSDDTMDIDCLRLFVAVLDEHKQCGVAMCALDMIDPHGQSLPEQSNWRSFPAPQFFGSIFDKKHIRLAPLDGVLSGTLHCIWHSVTQLMVRKSVYDFHGNYRTDLGSIADFEWNTRIAFHENVIYIPNVMATLRVHPSSASSLRVSKSVQDMETKISILKIALGGLYEKKPELAERLGNVNWTDTFVFQKYIYMLREDPLNGFREIVFKIIKSPMRYFCFIKIVLIYGLFGKKTIRREMTFSVLRKLEINIGELIKPI